MKHLLLICTALTMSGCFTTSTRHNGDVKMATASLEQTIDAVKREIGLYYGSLLTKKTGQIAPKYSASCKAEKQDLFPQVTNVKITSGLINTKSSGGSATTILASPPGLTLGGGLASAGSFGRNIEINFTPDPIEAKHLLWLEENLDSSAMIEANQMSYHLNKFVESLQNANNEYPCLTAADSSKLTFGFTIENKATGGVGINIVIASINANLTELNKFTNSIEITLNTKDIQTFN